MAENTSKKNTKIIIVIAAVIIVVLVGAVVVLATKINSNKNDVGSAEETTATTREVLVNEDNAESMVEELFKEETQAHLPVSHFAVDMTTVWHFPDGKSASTDAYVGNSFLNSTDVYFDVARRDNGEIIYSSPVIPLESALDEIVLNTDLDAGTYPCVLTYTLIDENQTPISTLNVAVEIIVEK